MTTAGQVTGYFNQTYAIEYTVEGDLDGSTLPPELEESPPTGINADDPQNLFRRTVDALGLIDPDYQIPEDIPGKRGARGNRLVTFLWISGASAGALGATVELVDDVDGTPIVQRTLGSLEGRTSLFLTGIFIPQGSMIRITGMTGSAADPVKVRLHIQNLDNARNLIAAVAAQSTTTEGDCCVQFVDQGFQNEVDQADINALSDGTTILLIGQPSSSSFDNGTFTVRSGTPNNTLEELTTEVGDVVYPIDLGIPFSVLATGPYTTAQFATQGAILVHAAAIDDVDVTATGAAAQTALEEITGATLLEGQLVYLGGQSVAAEVGFYSVAGTGASFALIHITNQRLFPGSRVIVDGGLLGGLQFTTTFGLEVSRLVGTVDQARGYCQLDTDGGDSFLDWTKTGDTITVDTRPEVQLLMSNHGSLLKLSLRADGALTFDTLNAVTIFFDRDGGSVLNAFSLDAAELPAAALVADTVMQIDLGEAFRNAGLSAADLDFSPGDIIRVDLHFNLPGGPVNVFAVLDYSIIPRI